MSAENRDSHWRPSKVYLALRLLHESEWDWRGIGWSRTPADFSTESSNFRCIDNTVEKLLQQISIEFRPEFLHYRTLQLI